MKRWLFLFIAFAFITALVFFFKNSVTVNEVGQTPVIHTVSPPQTVSTQASPLQAQAVVKDCQQLKKEYATLAKLPRGEEASVRFENTHLEYEGAVYRTRTFFKDGENGEYKQFLVYLESSPENAEIIESSSLTPGKLFKKLQTVPTEKIYHEVGATLTSGLFVQYINDELKMISGAETEHPFDCSFE